MNRLLDLMFVFSWFVAFALIKAFVVCFRYEWLHDQFRRGESPIRQILAIVLWPIDLNRHRTYLQAMSILQLSLTLLLAAVLVVAAVTKLS